MTCGDCGKQLVERTVATKTKKVDGDVIVLAQRQALVCDEHGVVAWDPTHTISYPVVPYVAPWPVVPAVPYRPWPVTVQPWTTTPGIRPYPYVTYGSGTNQLSAASGGLIAGTANRSLASAS